MTVPVITGATAQQCCGEGGGGDCAPGTECLPSDFIDPDDCSCAEGAYQPYCVGPENATDPDTLIASLSPFGYWKLDDASGNPQDSSGNGNHATAVSGLTYAQAPLSSKVGNSIALADDLGQIAFPDLGIATNMSDCDEEFTIILLVQFVTSAQPNGNGVVWMAHSYASTAVDWGFYFNDDVRTMWQILSQTVVGGVVQEPFTPSLNEPIVFAVRAKVLAAGLGIQTVFINGVAVCTGLRVNDNNAEIPGWVLGTGAGFFGSPGMRASNVCAWTTALTDDQVISVSESLMDAAMFAAATVVYP